MVIQNFKFMLIYEFFEKKEIKFILYILSLCYLIKAKLQTKLNYISISKVACSLLVYV